MRKALIRLTALFLILSALLTPFPLSAKEITVDAASHVLLYCLNTDSILYGKNQDTPVAPAQTAQMMTALLTLEHFPDMSVSVTLEASMLPSWTTVGDYHNPAVYGFTKGKTLTVADLFATLVLENSNAAALLLAALIGGDKESFTAKMNSRAAALGMENTVYKNPTGADTESAVTTPADTLKLASHLYREKRYTDLANAPSYQLANNGYTVYSRNYFVGKWYNTDHYYAPADGMLAGYSDKAGYVLVTSAVESNGYTYIAILFGGKSDAYGNNTAYPTVRELLAWGSSNFKYQKILSSSALMGTLPVKNGEGTVSVPYFPKKDLTAYLDKDQDPSSLTVKTELTVGSLTAPFEKGEVVGKVSVYQGDTLLGETELVTAKDVTKSKNAVFREFLGRFFKNPIVIIGILFILLLITRKILILIRRRKRAKKRMNPGT